MPCDSQPSLLYRSSLSAQSRINSIWLRGQSLGKKMGSVFIRIFTHANWMHPICVICLLMRVTFPADGKKQLKLGIWKSWKIRNSNSNKTGQLLDPGSSKIVNVILNPKFRCSLIFRTPRLSSVSEFCYLDVSLITLLPKHNFTPKFSTSSGSQLITLSLLLIPSQGRTPHILPLLQHGVTPAGNSPPQSSPTWVLPKGCSSSWTAPVWVPSTVCSPSGTGCSSVSSPRGHKGNFQ